MEVFLSRVRLIYRFVLFCGLMHPELWGIAHPAGNELCHSVSRAATEHFEQELTLNSSSGIAITASYAIRQSARLLKVGMTSLWELGPC